MTFRSKLLVALLPIALALVAVALLAGTVVDRLGEHSGHILADNYRSVLAAQRMKEALERVDSGAVFTLLGREPLASEQIARNRRLFEAELRVEEGNVTEPGEAEIARELRARWTRYLQEIARFRAEPQRDARTRLYFEVLQPQFRAVKEGADQILALNQDAMSRKSDRAQRSAQQFVRVIVGAALALALLGMWASAALTRRFLRPLSVVSQAVRRFGEGDLQVRARVMGRDEVAALAKDFNDMADSLERYRRSSLGELLQAQQASQAAIDSLPDPVIMLGLHGELLNVNEAATKSLKLSLENAGSEPLAALDPALRAAIERMRAHVVGGRGPYVPKGFEQAIRLLTSDGERFLLPRAAPIYGEEHAVSGVAVVLSDVTRLLRADELKNNLVAFVAHEFRTPLTSLQMAVHLCAEEEAGPLTEKQADLLFAAREDCQRLQTIVNDLLDVSRVHEGKIELSVRELDAEELVAEVLATHRMAAEERQVTLTSEVLPNVGAVLADPERVKLVFSNLVGNAVRYTPAGGRVIVRAIPGRDQMRFEVRDAGPGIPKEHQPLIFEKFYRPPGERGEGAGLGLFIARELVRAHGGAIGVSSEEGQGTTLWFTLPLARVATSALPSAQV